MWSKGETWLFPRLCTMADPPYHQGPQFKLSCPLCLISPWVTFPMDIMNDFQMFFFGNGDFPIFGHFDPLRPPMKWWPYWMRLMGTLLRAPGHSLDPTTIQKKGPVQSDVLIQSWGKIFKTDFVKNFHTCQEEGGGWRVHFYQTRKTWNLLCEVYIIFGHISCRT